MYRAPLALMLSALQAKRASRQELGEQADARSLRGLDDVPMVADAVVIRARRDQQQPVDARESRQEGVGPRIVSNVEFDALRRDLPGDLVVDRPDASDDTTRRRSFEKLADNEAAEFAGRTGDKQPGLIGFCRVAFLGRQIRASRPYGP